MYEGFVLVPTTKSDSLSNVINFSTSEDLNVPSASDKTIISASEFFIPSLIA